MKLTKVAKGFRKRTLVTAKLATKVGVATLKKQLNISGSEIDLEDSIRMAEKLVDEIDGMKGLIMKFGQIASYMGTGFPPEAQRILSRLQGSGISIEYSVIEDIIQTELGGSIDDIFDSFERDAFAAASIGQVHRAVYQGQDVAVKIQYPGIEDAIKSDLKYLAPIIIGVFMGQKSSGPELLKEFRDRILEECDYSLELENQKLFAKMFKGMPEIVIPKVIETCSTKRILTSEFIKGRDLYQFIDTATQEEKDKAARTIYYFSTASIYQYACFNSDPHPGNYLFLDDGTVCFLDFGSVKKFSPETIEYFKGFAQALIENDMNLFKQLSRRNGMAPKRGKFDWDYHWEMMSYSYRDYLTPGEFTFTKEFVNESFDLFIFQNKNLFSFKLPADMLFSNRLHWGLFSILADLNATGDWQKICNTIFATPATDLEIKPDKNPKIEVELDNI